MVLTVGQYLIRQSYCAPVSDLGCSVQRILAVRLSAILIVLAVGRAQAQPAQAPKAESPPTLASVLENTILGDWRLIDPEHTLVMSVGDGEVIIELAPQFAPQHVSNIRQLVRGGYFDKSAVLRVQENYVVQWGVSDDRPLGQAKERLPMETVRTVSNNLPFARLPDGDVYADQVGFSFGFPAARNRSGTQTWLTHCYGMVGVGRGMEADSGNGSSLYVVTGHAPRHLDKNITLVGRVLQGMQHLTTLPRGTGPLGFYETPAEYTPIRSLRFVADLPASARPQLEVLRTHTPSFDALIQARRNRHEDWFLDPVGKVELCNVPVPVRPAQ